MLCYDFITKCYLCYFPVYICLPLPSFLLLLPLSVHVSISHSPSICLSGSIFLSLSLLSEALDISDSIPPEIYQMLLVLQSVRKTPPAEQFYELQSLVSKVIHPYLCMQPSKNSSTLHLPQSISPSSIFLNPSLPLLSSSIHLSLLYLPQSISSSYSLSPSHTHTHTYTHP